MGLIRALALSPAIGVFLAILGVRTRIGGPWWISALFFTGIALLASGAVHGFIRFYTRLIPNRWLVAAAVGLSMTPITGLAIFAADRLFGEPRAPWSEIPNYLLISLIFSCFISLIVSVMRPQHLTGPVSAAPMAPAPPRFLERLPPKLSGADVWAVESEDHYLRLHTSKGSDLILMRLSDALIELEGLEGAQTHRSWWVARAAIHDIKRADGRATFTLPNGVEAPVSRAHAKALRERGWI
jgi:hypothetical protein